MNVRPDRRQAFEMQALPHSDALYRFGLRLGGNAADADDLVQETYLKAYLGWEGYEQGTNIRAWLFRIMKNAYINVYRRKSGKFDMAEYSETKAETSSRLPVGYENNPQELALKNLLDDEVSGAVECLPDNYRVVVILRDIEGLTYEEIARFAALPLGTVRSRLHRGRKLLRPKLYDYARDRGYVPPAEGSAEIPEGVSGK